MIAQHRREIRRLVVAMLIAVAATIGVAVGFDRWVTRPKHLPVYVVPVQPQPVPHVDPGAVTITFV